MAAPAHSPSAGLLPVQRPVPGARGGTDRHVARPARATSLLASLASSLATSALAAVVLGGAGWVGYNTSPAPRTAPLASSVALAPLHEAMAAEPGVRARSSMVADALAILGVAEGRAGPTTAWSVAQAAPRRSRLRAPGVDPVTTGSIPRPAMRPLPTGAAPKRGRLAMPPVDDRIERAAKSGRLTASVRPALLFAAPETEGALENAPIVVANALIPPPPVFDALPDTVPAPVMVARTSDGAIEPTFLTAYAPVSKDFAARARFDSLLQRPGKQAFAPPIGAKDHGWAARMLKPAQVSQKQRRCLAEGIYFEARGESKAGQAAVAQVILNRVRAPSFPGSVCGVVYQNKHWRNRCQFSFACDGIRDRIRSRRAWKIAQQIADAVSDGRVWFKDVGSSTHYHADYVNPRWNRHMVKVATVGRHIFYRTRNGGWD